MINSNSLLQKKLLDFYVYILLGPFIFMWHYFDRLKIIYILPLLFVFMILFANKIWAKDSKDLIVFKKQHFAILIGYVVLCLISILFNFKQVIFAGVSRDMLIFSTPLIIYGFDLKYTINHAKYLLIISIMSYFAIVGLDSDFSIHLSLFTTSGAKNEFHAGVLFGLFFILFLVHKRYYWIFLSAVFILLASKRAIFLGLIPALGVYYLFLKPFNLYSNKNKWVLFITLLFYYFILYPISINLEDFSSWLLGVLTSEEYNTVDFLMKREVFVDLLNAEIFSGDAVNFFLGHGPGQADLYLESGLPGFMRYLLGNPINPHNEFCKLHFDLGIIGVIYYFFIAYKMYINNSKTGVMIFLFTIPIFLVDNPLIFIYYSHIANILVNIPELKNEKHTISA